MKRFGSSRIGAGLHAEQRVVRLGVVAVRVVAVVGGEQRRAHVARQPDQLRVHLQLLGEAVVLQLDEERVAPEDRLEAVDELPREPCSRPARSACDTAPPRQPVVPTRPSWCCSSSSKSTRGFWKKPSRYALRRHLDEVAVALRRLGEQREVVDVVLVAPRPVVPARGDHVGLGADDRREVGVARGAVEVEDAVHVPVVGDADRGLAVGRGRGDDLAGSRAAPSSIEYSVWRWRWTNDLANVAPGVLSLVHSPVHRACG